ncbi:3-methyl-2-oxobutanoate dehydrogenase (2-methylpropanoyl-transferring) subunit alpha [Bradyrhizobium manausense]|uniref:thiamine pyrophosphate-dependent enzyme n=1 Tax=Bradyrhizobium manausense TaxID=989370 RepID=UPI001BA6021B|nr:thiamine pyrophosphate-dependent enzyme [Bradyrhizobium manausense]MBR0828624.1 3-methyl-2-oxobutanoate dehydrogenase (2-methylpropanoyl-transferring) subunit alpha [Bradyrhizobium manausense]
MVVKHRGLHVPVPAARPGDVPDFSRLTLPAAGSVGRPAPDIAESELRHLPYTLIRVLDEADVAVGEWLPKLDIQVLRDGLRAMLMTRIIDERMFRAHRQGKTSFYMRSNGEEAITAAQSLVLGPDDMTFTSYRSLTWLTARGYPLTDLFNQIFANAADPMKGRQMPVLYSARDYGFYSLSGNLGSRFGHAVGWAMAAAYKRSDRIAVAHIGDGTSAEGDFHEGMTFATVYKAPAILCIVNNQWAISSYSGIAGADETTFAAKALAYGVPGLRVDGNDFLAVAAATQWAVERIRAGLGATLIEFVTYRASAHSTSDDPTKYRPADDAAHWPLGDPVDRLKRHLIAIDEWSDERHVQLEAELTETIRAAQKEAEAIGTIGKSRPSLVEMFEGVFKEPDWRVIEQRREAGI